MGSTFCISSGMMRVSISPSSSALDYKAEVKSQAKPGSLSSHDKKERELVDGWAAHEEQVAELTNGRGCRSSEFPRRIS